jgi:hypothetical protein
MKRHQKFFFAAAVVVAAGSASSCAIAGHVSASPTCTFDGGGTIAIGTFATTTQQTTWVCGPGGQLTRVIIYVPPTTKQPVPTISQPIPVGVAAPVKSSR